MAHRQPPSDRKVWKFVIPVNDKPTRWAVPRQAKVLAVGNEGPDVVVVWIEVDVSREPEARVFRVFGTGHPIPEEWNYRGTTVAFAPPFGLVWHLYELDQDAQEPPQPRY